MLDGNSGTRGERVEKKQERAKAWITVKDDFGSMIQRGRKSFPYKL